MQQTGYGGRFCEAAAYLGDGVGNSFAGKVVLDFGCGKGAEAVAVALQGASRVYGLDVVEEYLSEARAFARSKGVDHKCTFLNANLERQGVEALCGQIDCIYSLDAMEHYTYPLEILAQMRRLLIRGGELLVSFGPPWNHPYGAHMYFFCPVPWVHYFFKEETILAVRSLFRDDGARRFEEVEGGLNRMSVAQFVALVKNSGFQIKSLQFTPIKGCAWLVRSSFFREYFTSVVRCRLCS